MNQEVKVEGMTCSGCANTVEKRFSGLPNVSHVEIDLDKKTATLTADKHIGEDALRAALEGTAYSVVK